MPTWNGRPWNIAAELIRDYFLGEGLLDGMTKLADSHSYYRYGLLQYFNPEKDLYANFDFSNLMEE